MTPCFLITALFRHRVFHNWSLFILQVGHNIDKEFMAVMLVHRRKPCEYFLFDVVRRDNNNLLFVLLHPPIAICILHQHLIVLLQPHILVELGESQGESECVLDPWMVFELSILSVKKVISQLLHSQQTLHATVQVAKVGIILHTHYSITHLRKLFPLHLLSLWLLNPLC
jgi:hypothetical protein